MRIAALLLWICMPASLASPLPGAQPPSQASESIAAADPLGQVLRSIRTAQQRLQRDLARGVRDIESGAGVAPVLWLGALAFLYGVLHAVGPGHGKLVISSYLLANETQVRRGIVLAFASSAVQAFSAVALVGLLAIILDMSQSRTTASVRTLELASYALLIGVGLWLLAAALRGAHGCQVHGHAGHHHGAHEHHSQPTPSGFLPLVLATGMRPCSGAVILLLFALTQGLFAVGVGATIAMAAGTAIAISALALLTLGSKHLALRLAGPGSVWSQRLQTGLAVAGALVIIVFGALLLLAGLNERAPL